MRACSADQERQEDRCLRAQRWLLELHGRERKCHMAQTTAPEHLQPVRPVIKPVQVPSCQSLRVSRQRVFYKEKGQLKVEKKVICRCLRLTSAAFLQDEVLIAGFGRRGHAVGDIPGVRFKVNPPLQPVTDNTLVHSNNCCFFFALRSPELCHQCPSYGLIGLLVLLSQMLGTVGKVYRAQCLIP